MLLSRREAIFKKCLFGGSGKRYELSFLQFSICFSVETQEMLNDRALNRRGSLLPILLSVALLIIHTEHTTVVMSSVFTLQEHQNTTSNLT